MEKVKSIKLNRDWTGPNGKVWYYDIEWESGLAKGQFSTNKDPQIKFVVGKEYNVYLKSTTKQGIPVYDIVRDQPIGNTGDRRLSPEMEYRIRKEVVDECITDTYSNLLWDNKDVSLAITIKDGYINFFDGKEDPKAASKALREAIKSHFMYSPQTVPDIVARAEKKYNWYMEPKK